MLLAACSKSDEAGAKRERRVAVEVTPVASGQVRALRSYVGTLEASSRFTATAKVSGVVEEVLVDLGDAVVRDQVVAVIDDAEPAQTAVQARGELAVEQARLKRAKTALRLAEAAQTRAREMHDKHLISVAELQEAEAALAAARADVGLARGQVQRVGATLELSRIRRGYTDVRAQWPERDGKQAVVAVRHRDAGSTVASGDPLVELAVLDPIVCAITVPERDYGRLRVDQTASLTTDAAPGLRFEARVKRIAPVFDAATRQARVELEIANPERKLAPGAFAEVELVLDEAKAQAVVPRSALTRRRDRDVLFLLGPSRDTVKMRFVEVGLQERDRVEVKVEGPPLTGEVVVLGQHLLGDGSKVRVIAPEPSTSATVAP